MLNFGNSVDDISSFLDSSEIIGILIGQSGEEQLHCGIVYRSNGRFNAIHLAWHFCLVHNDDYQGDMSDYLWVKSQIHEARQHSIAAMCRRILKRHREKKIPYGLLYSGGSFTKDGLLNLDSKESGLTCATFVMAVFSSCDIHLIDINNWESRASDSIWHKSVLEALKNSQNKFHISDLHIENVSKEIGCSRFRPEEVAISCTFNNIPANSENIIFYGQKLREIVIDA